MASLHSGTLALVIAAALLASGCVQQPQPGKQMGFVSAQGTEFAADGASFRFVGAFAFPAVTEFLYRDSYALTYQGAIDGYLGSLPPNVSVVRVFAFGPYVKSEYGFEEPNWERLDYLVESAEARGIRIIWVLYDSWDYGEAGTLEGYRYKFWEDDSTKQIILAQVSRYKDSPAVFGWELMNEGDAQARSDTEREEVYGWVAEVSESVKSIDGRHLVSTGFSNEDQQKEFILKVHALPNIDFVSFHAYGGNPDLQRDPSFFTQEWKSKISNYFNEMVEVRDALGKPVVAEEFGTQRQVGEPARKQVYESVFGEALRTNVSCLFNSWADDRTPSSLSIYTYDEEYGTVLDAAARIKNI